jgi:hypothetical protein
VYAHHEKCPLLVFYGAQERAHDTVRMLLGNRSFNIEALVGAPDENEAQLVVV